MVSELWRQCQEDTSVSQSLKIKLANQWKVSMAALDEEEWRSIKMDQIKSRKYPAEPMLSFVGQNSIFCKREEYVTCLCVCILYLCILYIRR